MIQIPPWALHIFIIIESTYNLLRQQLLLPFWRWVNKISGISTGILKMPDSKVHMLTPEDSGDNSYSRFPVMTYDGFPQEDF